MVKFDRFKCLRTDYFHNRCNICKELCPDAVSEKNLISIDESKLDYSVIGACPSAAFTTEDFDVSTFVLKFAASDEKVLSQSDLIALEALSVYDLLSIALRKEGFEIVSTHALLLKRVTNANEILNRMGFDFHIQINQKIEKNRREFFSKIFSEIKNKELDAKKIYSYESRIPQSMQIFKNSLKMKVQNLSSTQTDASFCSDKMITYEACDNCSECVKFCPSDALFYDNDRTRIYFNIGACIQCGICTDICHTDAIKMAESFDLVDFAFDKSKLLIEHNLVACSECKTPFAKKSDETKCKICREFIEKENLFALASQL
jgi:Pyruvate/2-oxoacid:ferredoxin oxidoreductase delta subunit